MIRKIVSALLSLYVLGLMGYGIFELRMLDGITKVNLAEVLESRRMPWEKQPKDPKPTSVISVEPQEKSETEAEIPVAIFDNVG